MSDLRNKGSIIQDILELKIGEALFFSAPLLPFAQSLMVILVHFIPIRPVLVMAQMEITRPC